MRNPQFLDPQETFEHYENRSRPTSSQSFDPIGSHGRLACEYRAAPPPQPAGTHGRLACEYRAAPSQKRGSDGVMACEYRANPVSDNKGVLACEYRANPPPDARYRIDDPVTVPQGAPKITTYLPDTTKKRIPLGVILAVAIGVPVVLVLCLFGAVWLQELGLL
uniref:Zonular occludens toxin n=1 Tax=Haemonchus contortus TaxID=6289 RepID=A0A7I4XY52_HAECO|nr:Protein F55D12.1 [Haemonchus contortus]